jgi:hypothetical protein
MASDAVPIARHSDTDTVPLCDVGAVTGESALWLGLTCRDRAVRTADSSASEFRNYLRSRFFYPSPTGFSPSRWGTRSSKVDYANRQALDLSYQQKRPRKLFFYCLFPTIGEIFWEIGQAPMILWRDKSSDFSFLFPPSLSLPGANYQTSSVLCRRKSRIVPCPSLHSLFRFL